MSLNKVMLIGNVGKDPEIRYLEGNSNNGTNAKVATFPLATSERYRDRNGEQHENTEWHNIVLWRGLADIAERYVRKGTPVYIEGHLRTRQWNDQTGNKRFTTEIIGDSMQLLGKRPDGQDGYAPAQGYAQQPAAAPSYQPAAPSYQPAAPAQPAPQPAPVDFSAESPADDLPF